MIWPNGGVLGARAAAQPVCVQETGLRKNLLEDLALKVVYLNGEMTLRELAEHLHLSLAVADEVFQFLRKEQLCEVKGMVAGIYRFALTTQGRTRAAELLALSHYVGPAPVPLSDYAKRVREQSVQHVAVHAPQMKRAFDKLVLSDDLLYRLGTAITSGTSIFIYGPPGTGKTTLAETIPEIYDDFVWIPYAVEVHNHIVSVFDPVVHKPLEMPSAEGVDTRWAPCRRPRIRVGGEITYEMLDLRFDPQTKYYSAPLQMKANNGVMIVDDIGRQRVSPEELLNRWITPLDRRIDFLSLAGGQSFEIPFDLFVVFATNLDLATLADEAFLRCIQSKIKLDGATREQFHEIFKRLCTSINLEYDASVVEHLVRILTMELKQPLRACYPRDIIQQICWRAAFEGIEPRLDRENIEMACRNYFLPPEN